MSIKPIIPTSRLAERTRELLEQRPRTITYPKIYLDTGITEAWLSDFVGNVDRDYGVNKVELLHNYLTGAQLDI